MYPFRPQYTIPASKKDEEHLSVHWIVTLCQGAALYAASKCSVDQCEKPEIMRVKQISVGNRAAYMAKMQRSRNRVMFRAEEKTIIATFSSLAPIDLTKPHVPQYVQDKETTCTFMNYNTMWGMSQQVAEYLTLKTPYDAEHGFEAINITTRYDGFEASENVFWYGKIKSVVNDGDYVVLDVENPNAKLDVRVLRSALRFDEIKPGYFLVYSSENEADIVSAADLAAYYYDIDRDDQDGAPYID